MSRRIPVTMFPGRSAPLASPHLSQILAIDVLVQPDVSKTIRGNAFDHEFYWTLVFDKPITSASFCSVPARRPLERPKARRHSSSAPRMPHVPMTTLDPVLQSYFSESRQAATYTLHPLRINAEARGLANFFLDDQGEGTLGGKIKTAAMALFFAGISDVKFTRSVALLVADTLHELRTGDCKSGRAAHPVLASQLLEAITGVTEYIFMACWTDKASFRPNLAAFDRNIRENSGPYDDALNSSAFLGALFSLAVINHSTMERCISRLAYRPASALRCRALYLLMLHASPSLARPLGISGLHRCRMDLLVYTYASPAMRLWLIEVCNIFDAMADSATEDVETTARSTTLRWDPGMRCDSLIRLCTHNAAIRLSLGRT